MIVRAEQKTPEQTAVLAESIYTQVVAADPPGIQCPIILAVLRAQMDRLLGAMAGTPSPEIFGECGPEVLAEVVRVSQEQHIEDTVRLFFVPVLRERLTDPDQTQSALRARIAAAHPKLARLSDSELEQAIRTLATTPAPKNLGEWRARLLAEPPSTSSAAGCAACLYIPVILLVCLVVLGVCCLVRRAFR